MTRRHRTAGALLVVATLAHARWARAQNARGGPVEVQVAPCLGASEREVRRVVALELETGRGEGGQLVASERVLVTADCTDDRIVLRATGAASGRAIEQAFRRPAHGARVSSRLLALAISELLGSDAAPAPANPSPAAPAPAPAPAQTQPFVRPLRPVRDPRDEHAVRLVALGSYRVFSPGTLALVGGGLRLGVDLGPVLSVSLDALYERGQTNDTRRAFDSTSLGATLMGQVRLPPFRLRAFGGLRAGLARTPDDAAPARVPWGGPLIAVSATAYFARVLVAELYLESGYAVVGSHTTLTGADANAIDGLWIGGHLSFGFSP